MRFPSTAALAATATLPTRSVNLSRCAPQHTVNQNSLWTQGPGTLICREIRTTLRSNFPGPTNSPSRQRYDVWRRPQTSLRPFIVPCKISLQSLDMFVGGSKSAAIWALTPGPFRQKRCHWTVVIHYPVTRWYTRPSSARALSSPHSTTRRFLISPVHILNAVHQIGPPACGSNTASVSLLMHCQRDGTGSAYGKATNSQQ